MDYCNIRCFILKKSGLLHLHRQQKSLKSKLATNSWGKMWQQTAWERRESGWIGNFCTAIPFPREENQYLISLSAMITRWQNHCLYIWAWIDLWVSEERERDALADSHSKWSCSSTQMMWNKQHCLKTISKWASFYHAIVITVTPWLRASTSYYMPPTHDQR